MSAPSYLELATRPGRPTVWDIPGAGPDHAHEVFPVQFEDGSIGLLPQAQIDAMSNLIDYSWEDELMSWNQNCNDTGEWVAVPYVTDDEEDHSHIIHHLASLRMRNTNLSEKTDA